MERMVTDFWGMGDLDGRGTVLCEAVSFAPFGCGYHCGVLAAARDFFQVGLGDAEVEADLVFEVG